MGNRRHHYLMASFAAITLLVFLGSVGCVKSGTGQSSEIRRLHIQKLLLVPVKNGTHIHGEGNVVRCAICGTSYMTGTVKPGAEAYITERLKVLLQERVTLISLPEEDLMEMRDRILTDLADRDERKILAAIGREMGADALITGTLYLFKQRVGSDYASDSPAAVGFDLDLINTADAQLIWNGHFDETQQPLSENLFTIGRFFKRKGKWLSAEQLAVAGLEQVLNTLSIAPGSVTPGDS